MEGVEGVMTRVEARLRAAMPAKLEELRTRYGIVDGSLEDIERYLMHEPDNVAIDKPPMIVVAEQESDNLTGPSRVTDDGRGGTSYRFRYSLLVFAWARGDTFETTAQARRRYGLAVREVLLQKPGLGDPDDPGTCVLRPESVQETYSDIARDGRSREVIGATAIAVEYETQEHLANELPVVAQTALGSTIGVTP